MYCTYCGNALPEAAVFCPKCGNRVPDTQSESPSSKPDQIPNNLVEPTVHKSRGFRILLYLAILFGGVISVDWAVSEVFSLPAEATYELTKMSLDAAIAVGVLGLVFARRRVTWKTTLMATGVLSAGFFFWVLSIRNQSGPHVLSGRTPDEANIAQLPPQGASTLAQKKLCSDQAEKNFNDSSFSVDKDSLGNTYTSHYDAASGVCYMEVTMRHMLPGNNFQHDILILDAFENRTYGQLTSFSKDQGPSECSVKPRGQPEITCKSNEEFDSLALQYFGTVPQ